MLSNVRRGVVRRRSFVVIAAGAVLAVGCGSDSTEKAATGPEATRAVAAYADLAHRQYSDALAGVRSLDAAVDHFLAEPTAATQTTAQKAWRDSRPAYLRTETFRFYDGPIDNADTGREGFINAWPLDEGYIDYVDGDARAGIINKPDVVPTLTAETIADQNEKGGETNIATGYHAIEFLLWGQDSDPVLAGKRPATDFSVGGPNNADRRRQYLKVVSDLLVTDLQGVVDAWAPGTGAYRRQFTTVSSKEALRRVLTGMATLAGGELSGDRLGTPYESKDREDEHSCFSDNTTVDHIEDARGIQQVWKSVLQPLVQAKDPALAAAFETEVNASVAAAMAIPVPFDQAILGNDDAPGRRAVLATIKALEAQTATTVKVAKALGLKINTGA